MEAKLINLEFTFAGFKFTGELAEYAQLVSQAKNEVSERKNEMNSQTDTLVVLYEQPASQNQKTGVFYVGYMISAEESPQPESVHFIRIKGKYVIATGTISQMGDIYSTIGNWVAKEGMQPVQNTYIIEIYEKPFVTENVRDSSVQVCWEVN